MEKHLKPIMHPDRVLSLVVLSLSLFMILGSAYLSYAQTKIQEYTLEVKKDSDARVMELTSARQQVLGVTDEEGEEGSVTELVDEETD